MASTDGGRPTLGFRQTNGRLYLGAAHAASSGAIENTVCWALLVGHLVIGVVCCPAACPRPSRERRGRKVLGERVAQRPFYLGWSAVRRGYLVWSAVLSGGLPAPDRLACLANEKNRDLYYKQKGGLILADSHQ